MKYITPDELIARIGAEKKADAQARKAAEQRRQEWSQRLSKGESDNDLMEEDAWAVSRKLASEEGLVVKRVEKDAEGQWQVVSDTLDRNAN